MEKAQLIGLVITIVAGGASIGFGLWKGAQWFWSLLIAKKKLTQVTEELDRARNEASFKGMMRGVLRETGVGEASLATGELRLSQEDRALLQQVLEVVKGMERLAPRAEDAETHFLKGNTLYGAQRYQEVAAEYTDALRLRPDYPEAYVNRGTAYGRLGEHQKAIADYNEALRLRPAFPEAYNNRGVAYGRLGEYQKALADYNEALRLRPEFASIYYNLACLYSLQQDIEPCVANLERAVALDAKHKEQGRSDLDLEWARQDARVRKLLDIP